MCSRECAFVSVCRRKPSIQLSDFYETWFEFYAMGFRTVSVWEVISVATIVHA